MTTTNYTSPITLCYNTILTFLNNPKDLDPSYKMDLDFWNCFGREKNLRLIAEEIRHIRGRACIYLLKEGGDRLVYVNKKWRRIG